MRRKIKGSCLLAGVAFFGFCVALTHFWPALQRFFFWLQQTVAGWW